MEKFLRSFIFIPADKEKMLDKINVLSADAFILDLEDSVSAQNKKLGRINISDKIKSTDLEKKIIFIRLNDLDSDYVFDDINETISKNIYGYMIPKFENAEQLKGLIYYLSYKEREIKLTNKLKLILMIESPKGLLELNNINNLSDRIIALALGAEDYLFSLSEFGNISETMVDYARQIIIQYSKANNYLSIDTVFREYKNNLGLQEELRKIIGMGFSSKLAIHPSQIEIINSSFTPSAEEINKAEVIIKHKEDFEDKGAISMDGVMYDYPHLKWAKKIKSYINKLGEE
ncbi:MAG: HpcH/HpaI aldolase/citrate lyase family protein [Candidatus Humimicrobiaceae bacterium]